MSSVKFSIVQEHCRHQGMIKEGKKWCGYIGGVPARCWDDWKECCEANCFLVNKKQPAAEPEFKQLSIFDKE